MARIYIGTSGYSYKDWVGPFYREGAKQSEFLKIYAQQFNIVELNFSYYKMPETKTIDKMLGLTNDKFQFAIKAHKSITHEMPEDPCEAITRFRHGILPMIESSKLAAIFLQFPYSFHYTVENRKYLQKVCLEFENLSLAVEFRNTNWLKNSVFQNLKKLNVALVSVDEPDLKGLLKPTDIVISKFAYIRFHGRNKINWWKGDNISRYDYLYNDAELNEWIPRINKMSEETEKLFIFFNNHYRGQAVKNAKNLEKLLKKA